MPPIDDKLMMSYMNIAERDFLNYHQNMRKKQYEEAKVAAIIQEISKPITLTQHELDAMNDICDGYKREKRIERFSKFFTENAKELKLIHKHIEQNNDKKEENVGSKLEDFYKFFGVSKAGDIQFRPCGYNEDLAKYGCGYTAAIMRSADIHVDDDIPQAAILSPSGFWTWREGEV
jgi:hypothetical protein